MLSSNRRVIRVVRDSGLNINDSVVMGDVQQNITNIQQSVTPGVPCPRCGVVNARIIHCSIPICRNQFCGLCHPICRWSESGVSRFDSGKGHGPYCRTCMDRHANVRGSSKLKSIMSGRGFLALLMTLLMAAMLSSNSELGHGNFCLGIIGILTFFCWVDFFVSQGNFHKEIL